ncbi:RNA-directed DNA polymerase, eukaryota [Tanacetum coccineum]
MEKTHKSKSRKVKPGKETNNKDHIHESNLMENITRGEKRDDHPTTSTTSGENRILKRRESNGDEDGEGVNNTDSMDVGVRNSNKKSGRKSITKAKKVVRQQGVGSLGTSEKGTSDVYKVFNDKDNGTNKPFVFRSTRRAESDSKSCSINMEQVKEIGELIGVSWAKAESEKAKDVEAVEKEPEILVDHQGIGEAGKKEWIKSIIRVEQPDIIGGIIMIWDARSLTYKGGLGDERFVAVSGEWKGKARDVDMACIYGPHVGRQKASLWNIISRLMDSLKGAWCIFGDLNVVRRHDERMNSQINIKETCDFNDFINEAKLIEIPMGGENI